MSHIPNSAIPHANADALEDEQTGEGETLTLKERAAKLATSASELARDNPKTAIAAGAALFAGAVAAAAIPAARARSRKSGGTASGSRSSTAKRKKS